jgi:iron complex outermembrane receptor protein
VQSEILDSYEVGAKNSFLGGRLKTDGDVFVGKYTNIQVQLVNAASGTVTLQNAGAADLFGVEYNARFHLDDHWRFDGGVTYLHSKFTEYANAAVFAPNPAGIGLVNATEDLSGSVLPRSPKWTLFFAPDFSYDLEGGWTTETSVIAHCTTSYDFTADAGGPLNSDRQGAYATIDATFTVTTPDGKADLSLYGTNITATHYREFAQTAAYGAFYVPGAPRSYGVRATYRF